MVKKTHEITAQVYETRRRFREARMAGLPIVECHAYANDPTRKLPSQPETVAMLVQPRAVATRGTPLLAPEPPRVGADYVDAAQLTVAQADYSQTPWPQLKEMAAQKSGRVPSGRREAIEMLTAPATMTSEQEQKGT